MLMSKPVSVDACDTFVESKNGRSWLKKMPFSIPCWLIFFVKSDIYAGVVSWANLFHLFTWQQLAACQRRPLWF
jgi:hypothetical protein